MENPWFKIIIYETFTKLLFNVKFRIKPWDQQCFWYFFANSRIAVVFMLPAGAQSHKSSEGKAGQPRESGNTEPLFGNS